MTRLHRPNVQAGLLLLVITLGAIVWHMPSPSTDLMASWIAGQFLAAGELSQIYPTGHDVFTVKPPPDWPAFMAERGYNGPIYPFIYPPLWAAVMTPISTIQGFWVFSAFATLVNCALLSATAWLGLRASGTRMHPVVYIAVVMALLLGTQIGRLGLLQNQHHIPVSFLLVLAIERSRAGAQGVAGAALALAASIKLFPALFALMWLMTGERRALLSFAVSGATLAGLSIALTGWPLHSEFLRQVFEVSDTAILTGVSYSIMPALLQIVAPAELIQLFPATGAQLDGSRTTAYYLELSAGWKTVARVLIVAAIAAAAWLMSRTPRKARASFAWPFTLTIVALCLPLSWSYYYIASIVFLPAVVDRLGPRSGWIAVAVVAAGIALPLAGVYRDLDLFLVTSQVIATAALCLMAGAFFAAGLQTVKAVKRKAPRSGRQGLHPKERWL